MRCKILFRACGINHCLAVTTNKWIFAWGDNSHYQCGVEGNCNEPRLITSLLGLGVSAVICGGGHSIAICNNGSTFSWGINGYGQCGYTGTSPIPKKVDISGKIKGGSAGLGHTLLLLESGQVYGSGWNFKGQLGNGNNTNSFQFVQLEINDANFISCGAEHSLIVTKDGHVFVAGGNACGQLGLGHYQAINRFTKIKGLEEISIGRCGEEFTIVVSIRCIVYTFGNYYSGLGNVGQLGYNEEQNCEPKIVDKMPGRLGTEYVACTKSTVLVVTRNYSTYSWGLIPDYTKPEIIPQAPTQLSILKSKRVREIQCLREAFFICSDYIIQNSYVSNIPLGSIEAGKKHKLKVNLIDSSMMFVVDPLDKIGVACFNSNGDISKGEICSYWDQSSHYIELKIEESGYHYVYAFCNSIQLKNSPFIYTVKHGPFFEAKAYVNSEDILINAGVGFIALVKAYDRYGNLVIQDPKILFSINIGGKCEIIDFEEGCYRVIIYCTEIGKHPLVINGNNKNVSITFKEILQEDEEKEVWTRESIDVQVLPGIICPNRCSVEGLKDEYIAGETVPFAIISRDEFGNTTWHRSKPWTIEIPLAYSNQESVDYCSTYVSFISQKSCLIPIKISYEDTIIFTATIKINPSTLHIPYTVISGEGSTNIYISKPITREFTIEFYDIYCNPCSPTGFTLNCSLKYSIEKINNNTYKIIYQLDTPGHYLFQIQTGEGNLQVNIKAEKDPKLVKQEKIEQKLMEKNQKIMLEEQEKLEENERRKRIEEETKRNMEIRAKQRMMEENAKKQKEMDDAEILRRQKIVDRIKLQEITKKRGIEALQKLEEEKKKKEPKKWKRIGGGFIVPFILDEDT